MPSFSVINLGCKVNRAESDSMERELLEMGMRPSDERCDVVIINTCTVTSIAEKKTRKAVRQAIASNPEASIIVTGCAAAQNPSVYEEMSERVKVVLKWDIGEYLDDFKSDLQRAGDVLDTGLHIEGERYCRANVKIQDGCINECTYCIIHKLRGPEVSIAPEQVASKVSQLAKSGISEVILSGINLGRYDHEGTSLEKLCEMLLEREKRCRFRLSSIEPNNVTEEIVDLVSASEGRICRHFHLPLQSGCDRTLMRMGRKYGSQHYKDVVALIRERIPNVSLSTDVICGFPGETDEDFRETERFCEELGFSKIHVFPYSPRKGTPAADMDDQIDLETKNRRARKLREIATTLRLADLEKRRGTMEIAVIEDDEWCMSESYHRLKSPEGASPGDLVEVQI